MSIQRRHRLLAIFLGLFLAVTLARPAYAEDEESPRPEEESSDTDAPPPPPPPVRKDRRVKPKGKREYLVEKDDRSDAGVFHVGFAAGGNFYIEPKLLQVGTQSQTTGEYFKDFGFQGGVYFDFDYSEIEQNIPLMLRGMAGYKYILNSTHVFAFDGVARRQWRFSEKATFGVGLGASAAVWYRAASTTPPVSAEEVVFRPGFIATAGFEFNPFMVDFKWVISRIGEDSTNFGLELYFGFRL